MHVAPGCGVTYTETEGARMAEPESWHDVYDGVLARLLDSCRDVYGGRLVSLVVFGSVGRGTPRADSDVDLLIVARDLPKGRLRRVEEFGQVESRLGEVLDGARLRGVNTRFSPVFKTPEEARRGSPLFLDMVDDARLLHDGGGFFATLLDDFRQRLSRLGARRIWRGDVWLWDLKPDFQPGDVFEL